MKYYFEPPSQVSARKKLGKQSSSSLAMPVVSKKARRIIVDENEEENALDNDIKSSAGSSSIVGCYPTLIDKYPVAFTSDKIVKRVILTFDALCIQ